MNLKRINQDYLRSFVFGCEDALVSTTGIVVGVGIAAGDKSFVILTSIVTVAVEALSMAAGQYLSEKSVHDMPGSKHKDSLILGSLIMFVSYVLGGIVPVLPVLFFSGVLASVFSVLSAFGGLFALGYFKARLFSENAVRSSVEMLVIGGLAVLMGLGVGLVMKR